MSTQTFNWCRDTEIDCGSAFPLSVIFCVPASIVSPEVETEFGFVEAVITQYRPSTCSDPCGLCKHVYTVEYDDEQLVEGYLLTGAYIHEVLCGCVIDYIQTVISGVEVEVEDTESLDLSVVFADNVYTISGDVILAEIPTDNMIVPSSDGLFVDAVTVQDTNSVNLTNTVVAYPAGAQTLSADVKISSDADNAVSIHSDGLYAAEQEVLAVTDSSSIDFSIGGTIPQTLTGAVKISADALNIISIHADGIYAAQQLLAVTDSSTIDFTIGGTIPQTITGAVKISADGGNTISAHADGIYSAGGGGGGSGWLITGNAGTVAGTNFCGTTDNVGFDVRVNNVIVKQTIPNANCVLFINGDSATNSIGAGDGNAILSGSHHEITNGDRSMILGGRENTITDDPTGGSPGFWNGQSVILGGYFNEIYNGGTPWTAGSPPASTSQGQNVVCGGFANFIVNQLSQSFIGAGYHNRINYDVGCVSTYAACDVVVGGESCEIFAYDGGTTLATFLGYNVITGGYNNHLDNGLATFSGGGYFNQHTDLFRLYTSFGYPTPTNFNGPYTANSILGGVYSFIDAAQRSVIGGGHINLVFQEDCSGIFSGAFNQIVGATQPPIINASNLAQATIVDPPNANGIGDAILGGLGNTIYDGKCSSILGGAFLKIGANTVGYQSSSTRTMSGITGGTKSYTSFNSGVTNLWPATQVDTSAFSDIAYFGDVDVWIANTDGSATKLKFIEPNTDLDFSSANYTTLRAQTQAANVDYILPAAGGAVGNVLQLSAVSGTDNTMSWATDSSLLGSRIGANFNSTADQTITINAARYYITAILVTNASTNLTTAVGGIYAAAAKSTPLIEATTDYTALAVSSDAQYMDWALNQSFINANMTSKVRTESTLYLSLTTAQGAAATADVYVYGKRLA